MKVLTTKGLIERELLTATDIVTEEQDARVIATEWHFEGELVRRDVNVNILAGQAIFSEQSEL